MNKEEFTERLNTLPWERLFAPKKLDDVVLPKRIKSQVEHGIQRDFLFHGSPGTGKSTLAKIMIANHNYLYVNASDEGKVDFIRERLHEFAKSVSLDIDDQSSTKVVFFDELDGASRQFYLALRGFMDTYPNVRFIATCNYINKVEGASNSRFKLINFDYKDDEELREIKQGYIRRIVKIMKVTGMDISNVEEAKKVTAHLVNSYYPDFRDIIQALQSIYVAKLPVTMESLDKAPKPSYAVFDAVFSKDTTPESIHKLVMGYYQSAPSDTLVSMGKSIYDYVSKKQPYLLNVMPHMIVKIAEYQNKLATAIDPLIVLKACVFELNMLYKSTLIQNGSTE